MAEISYSDYAERLRRFLSGSNHTTEDFLGICPHVPDKELLVLEANYRAGRPIAVPPVFVWDACWVVTLTPTGPTMNAMPRGILVQLHPPLYLDEAVWYARQHWSHALFEHLQGVQFRLFTPGRDKPTVIAYGLYRDFSSTDAKDTPSAFDERLKVVTTSPLGLEMICASECLMLDYCGQCGRPHNVSGCTFCHKRYRGTVETDFGLSLPVIDAFENGGFQFTTNPRRWL